MGSFEKALRAAGEAIEAMLTYMIEEALVSSKMVKYFDREG